MLRKMIFIIAAITAISGAVALSSTDGISHSQKEKE